MTRPLRNELKLVVRSAPVGKLPREGETLTQRTNRFSQPDYVIDHETGCWMWQRSTDKKGYPQHHSGKAHHIYWELATGRKVPYGHHVHHKCESISCVNPAHLEMLSPSEHFQHHRLTLRGLTLDDIREIRRLGTKRGISDRKLGEQYGVSFMVIQRVWRGESWAKELGITGSVELEPGECEWCGAAFTGGRRDRRFCDAHTPSHARRVAA